MRKTILHKTVFSSAIVLLIFGVGFGFLRSGSISGEATDDKQHSHQHDHEEHSNQPHEALSNMDGEALFKQMGCVNCHAVKKEENSRAPNLAGLFDRNRLPASGREATEENVRHQLKDPYRNMPSFADSLTDDQRDRIISYLKNL